jgi:hypothetical protein
MKSCVKSGQFTINYIKKNTLWADFKKTAPNTQIFVMLGMFPKISPYFSCQTRFQKLHLKPNRVPWAVLPTIVNPSERSTQNESFFYSRKLSFEGKFKCKNNLDKISNGKFKQLKNKCKKNSNQLIKGNEWIFCEMN